VEVAVGQRDSTPHDVFGAAERPSRVSWRDQADRSSLSAQFEDEPGQIVPPAPRVRTSSVPAPKGASSRAEEVSMTARLEATRLLDIVGEEHFRVAGGDNSRLSSPPEQRRETIIARLIGAGGKQGAANIRCRRGFQNWLRWLQSASTVGLVSAEEAKSVMPVMAEDIEALIHWLRLSGEGGAADSIRPGMEYAQNVLDLPVECNPNMTGGTRPRSLKSGTKARDASPPLFVAAVEELCATPPSDWLEPQIAYLRGGCYLGACLLNMRSEGVTDIRLSPLDDAQNFITSQGEDKMRRLDVTLAVPAEGCAPPSPLHPTTPTPRLVPVRV